jgi:hypothetical protein
MYDFITEIEYEDIFLALFTFNINELILIRLYNSKNMFWLIIYNTILVLLAYLYYKYKVSVKNKIKNK